MIPTVHGASGEERGRLHGPVKVDDASMMHGRRTLMFETRQMTAQLNVIGPGLGSPRGGGGGAGPPGADRG